MTGVCRTCRELPGAEDEGQACPRDLAHPDELRQKGDAELLHGHSLAAQMAGRAMQRNPKPRN